jgi:YD repeat-containing protein
MVGQLDRLTFAGVTVLRFDEQGKVIEHRDYDNHIERRATLCRVVKLLR